MIAYNNGMTRTLEPHEIAVSVNETISSSLLFEVCKKYPVWGIAVYFSSLFIFARDILCSCELCSGRGFIPKNTLVQMIAKDLQTGDFKTVESVINDLLDNNILSVDDNDLIYSDRARIVCGWSPWEEVLREQGESIAEEG